MKSKNAVIVTLMDTTQAHVHAPFCSDSWLSAKMFLHYAVAAEKSINFSVSCRAVLTVQSGNEQGQKICRAIESATKSEL